MNHYAKGDPAYNREIQEKAAAYAHWKAEQKGLGGLTAGGLDSAARQPEVPALLETLSRELAEAEATFAELRGRLGIVTRPEAPEQTGQSGPPHAVPNTDVGNLIHGLVSRVDSLTGSMRSLTRRLEV